MPDVQAQRLGCLGRAALPNPHGLEPKLVTLPDGFYHRILNNHALPPEIVCGKCGSVVLDD
jgi:hypothetical protein